MNLLARASLRHARRHPLQVACAWLGIALGVAVVTAIDLTEASARRAFAVATEAVAGRTTHRIQGGPAGVDEHAYARLQLAGTEALAAPIIEAAVRIDGKDAGMVTLLGLDPIAAAPLRGADGIGADDPRWRRLMTEPGTAWVSAALARRLGLQAGGGLGIVTAHGPAALRIVGVIQDRNAGAGAELIVTDIATAQELLAMPGRISRIDLSASDAQARAALAAAADPALTLVDAPARSTALFALTDAFYTHLRALSLLALLVGVFLVYNAQSFMVLQRRAQFAMLRALGTGRRAIVAVVLAESALIGIAGAVAGLVLGEALARELLALVTRTVNDLYFPLASTPVHLEWRHAATAAALGIAGAMAAGALPAIDATRGAPRAVIARSNLEVRSLRRRFGLLGAGALLGALGIALLAAPGGGLTIAFLGLGACATGAALAVPAALIALTHGLLAVLPARADFALRMGVRGVAAALSRTGVATAALMLAVAATIGIGLMVSSFRIAVGDWLRTALRADWYLGSTAAAPALTRAQHDRIAALPGVVATSTMHRVTLPDAGAGIELYAYELPQRGRAGFVLLAADDEATLWHRFETADVVMVTEPFAWRRALAPGDRLRLPTDAGPRAFMIGAVYRDYASDRGHVAMSRATFERHWRDDRLTGIGLYTAPGVDPARLRAGIVDIVGTRVPVTLVSNREILERSIEVFDRTFLVTDVLRLLAGVIAFAGVLGALTSIELERSRELAMMRALGCARGALLRMVLTETAVIGLAAGLLAIPAGIGLAAALVYVINRRSFGWSMQLALDPWLIASGLALALGAALLAALYPARRMARAVPAAMLRGE
ncbi:MAG: ABC transporter permease [Gammaproteobacteria bacterium]